MRGTGGDGTGKPEEELLMIVDPETREAHRRGEGPADGGPVFFTSREKLEAYAQANGLADYQIYPVPAGILGRLKGQAHWVDGEPSGPQKARGS